MNFLDRIRSLLETSTPNDQEALDEALRLLAAWRSDLIANTIVKLNGPTIQSGPFSGMNFVSHSAEGCLAPKLLGTYEYELQPFIEGWAVHVFDAVINIGCADGYYAVGLARRLPHSRIYAYDTDENARTICQKVAEANGVDSRFEIGAIFRGQDFARFEGQRCLVVCDIEGGELNVLDPEVFPALQKMDVLVECYDSPQLGAISVELARRFEPTHDVIRVSPKIPSVVLPDWLRQRAELDQLLSVWEGRGAPNPWLVLHAQPD